MQAVLERQIFGEYGPYRVDEHGVPFLRKCQTPIRIERIDPA